MDDWQLLNDYATRNSEEAFHALVERYAGMVYHTALRQLGNPHSAEEVAQAVFIILAQKAATIRRQTTLYGWLFRATRFAVLNQRRQEKNRARREQEAYAMQSASNSDDLNPVWEQITPHLDDALDKLPVMDRELVMIRYFGNKSHKEAAQTLGVSEDVVRKRLSRAMEKLRVIFVRRGVAVSSLALVTAFTAHGVQAAPLGLASSLAGVAVAKGATASGSTLTLIKGALKIMAWTKAKTAIVVGASVLLAVGTTTVVIQHQRHLATRNDVPRAAWVFLGYGDPKSAMLTFLYAIRQADGEQILAACSPGLQQTFQKHFEKQMQASGKSLGEFLSQDAPPRFKSTMGIRIVEQKPASEDRITLRVLALGEQKEHQITVRKIGDEWKVDEVFTGSP